MDEEVLALVAITLIGAGAVVGIAFSPIARALAASLAARSWKRPSMTSSGTSRS
jgi:hypothetical protein